MWLGEKRFAWPVLCCVVVGSEKGREFVVDAMGQQKGMCAGMVRGSQSRVLKSRSTPRRIRGAKYENHQKQHSNER